MHAKNRSVLGNVGSGLDQAGRSLLQEAPVIIVRYKADLLAFRFVGHSKTEIGGQLASFRLGQAAQRQQEL